MGRCDHDVYGHRIPPSGAFMIPLTVTLSLTSPPAFAEGTPLRLDGLLMGALGHVLGRAHSSGWVGSDEVEAHPLPLARVELPDGRWWWAASALTLLGPEEPRYRHKRPALDMLETYSDARTVCVAAGPDKAMRLPYYVRPEMGTLAFTCIGDIDEVSELVRAIVSVGKHVDGGHGWVDPARSTVVPGGPDLDAYRTGELRPVPMDVWTPPLRARFVVRDQPLRPPYWRKTETEPVWVRF